MIVDMKVSAAPNASERIFREIESATDPRKFFGTDPDARFKSLAVIIHPDRHPGALNDRATKAFQKLSEMFSKLKNGGSKTSTPAVFGKWVVEQPLCGGDIADLYQVTSEKVKRAVLKIARSASDNDLIDNEVAHLKKLHADTRSTVYQEKYLPKVYDVFKASGRKAIVMQFAEEGLLDTPNAMEARMNLAEIVKLAGKLDFRHVVWMSNRVLAALGFAHLNGIVHGAILPTHLMFGPITHGMTLVDWCYSVSAEDLKPIAAISKDYRRFYPKEVFRKDNPTPSLDIFMWAMVVREVSESIPARFRGLLDYCLADSYRARPKSAWELMDQWGRLAKEEFGLRRYLKLHIPTV